MSQAKSVPEKIEVYNLLLVQYNMRAKYEEAVQAGKEALRLLGIELPTEDLPGAISAEVASAKENLGSREIADLMDVPEITAWLPLATVKLLNNLAPSVYMLDPQLWTVIVLKGSNICIEYGYAPESSFFYPTYGILLGVMFGEYKSAYEFGMLGLKLNERWGQPVYKASATMVICLNYWFNHLKEANEIANVGYQSALDSGDLQYGGYMLLNKLMNLYMQGYDCVKLLSEVPKYLQFSQKTENRLVTDTLTGLHLVLLNLNSKTPTKCDFQSETVGEAEYIETCQQHQNFYSLGVYHIFKWYAIVIYERRSYEVSPPGRYQHLMAPHVRRFYLDELGEAAEQSLGMGILRLVVETQKKTEARAKQLIAKTKQELSDVVTQQNTLELIETIVLYKFPQLSREELETMLGLSEIKQTRIYKEAVSEGIQVGRQEGIQVGELQTKLKMVSLLLELGLTVEQISQRLELDMETVIGVAQQQQNLPE